MKCKNCKKEIDDDSLFCEYCGTRVQKKSKKWLWVGIALVACILVIVGINSLIEYSEEKEMLEHQEYIAQQQAIEEQRVADSLVLVAQQQAEEAARQAEISRRKEAERQRQAELERQREAERKKTELLKSFYVDLDLSSGTWWGKTNAGGGYLYTHDEAVSKFGSELPTKTQWEELKSRCTWTWTHQNGVKGYKVTGPNGNSIFLPAAGYRDGSGVSNVQYCGYYWSATMEDGIDRAGCLYFSSDKAYVYYGYRYDCKSVRLVKDL